jgi:ABC-2 type transport system ATP-binding protein
VNRPAPDPAPAALEALGLGKRYRRGWALRDCSFRLPVGRVCGLVGPNGAGKSTLLSLAAGLAAPTEGSVRLLGAAPGSPEARRRVAFLAQDKPLYRRLTVRRTLDLGRALNPGWDQDAAERIVAQRRISPSARIGTLSGGQRARVALALALGKRPDLLLLDEPFADVDPLARRELTGELMALAAEHGTTVVISSHALAELDGVCDFVVVVTGGRVRLAGDVDEILAAHRVLVGVHAGTGPAPELARHQVVDTRTSGRHVTALVRPGGPPGIGWDEERPRLEELLLGYLRAADAPALLTPDALPETAA